MLTLSEPPIKILQLLLRITITINIKLLFSFCAVNLECASGCGAVSNSVRVMLGTGLMPHTVNHNCTNLLQLSRYKRFKTEYYPPPPVVHPVMNC